eukprot:sb/3467660/
MIFRSVLSRSRGLLTRSLASTSAPVITVQLPKVEDSRSFVITSNLRNLKDLQDAIVLEDPSVQTVNAVSSEGVLFSKSTPLSYLLQNGFTLEILDEHLSKHSVGVEATEVAYSDAHEVTDKIKNLAASLEIVENKIAIQENLRSKLEKLEEQFTPLEQTRLKLQRSSAFRTNAVVWGGLFVMGGQFGFLARLVWWDYSWDIMEPVTYFVTYGTAIVMYSYFVCVRSDYNFDTARERWNLRTFHKICRRNGFDHDKYNSIVEQMREIEANMTQLENVGALLNVKEDTNTM